MTGTATGRTLSSSEPMLPPPRTLPSVPSITLGVNPRRPLPLAPASSGSLITSIARARLGSRRIKPRSSRAVMRRWMPDFERRSRASFISSKEGGTPDSFRRSLMNRRSSYCLRVSISTSPPGLFRYIRPALNSEAPLGRRSHQSLETNHERTLSVRYVFCNHLIFRQWKEARQAPARDGLFRQSEDVAGLARFGGRRERPADQKCPRNSEIRQQRTVLVVDGRGDQLAVFAHIETSAEIIFALIIGSNWPAEYGLFDPVADLRLPRKPANQRNQKQQAAHIGRHWIAGQTDHPHRAKPSMHHGLARP